jgi:hypothetical protein
MPKSNLSDNSAPAPRWRQFSSSRVHCVQRSNLCRGTVCPITRFWVVWLVVSGWKRASTTFSTRLTPIWCILQLRASSRIRFSRTVLVSWFKRSWHIQHWITSLPTWQCQHPEEVHFRNIVDSLCPLPHLFRVVRVMPSLVEYPWSYTTIQCVGDWKKSSTICVCVVCVCVLFVDLFQDDLRCFF